MKNFKSQLTLTLLLGALVLFTTQLQAQDDKSKRPSPPAEITKNIGGVDVTVNYSQPSVKGREIWGGLVPYGKVWRAGANEATWISVSEDVTINGKDLPKGKYAFFVTPVKEGEWTLIFNSVPNQWGAYNYDSSKDVLTVMASPSDAEMSEKLTYSISDAGKVTLVWDKKSISFVLAKK